MQRSVAPEEFRSKKTKVRGKVYLQNARIPQLNMTTLTLLSINTLVETTFWWNLDRTLSMSSVTEQLRIGFCVQNSAPCAQTRILGLGCNVDGNVGIGVFPECEEISVGGECSGAGCGIGA